MPCCGLDGRAQKCTVSQLQLWVFRECTCDLFHSVVVSFALLQTHMIAFILWLSPFALSQSHMYPCATLAALPHVSQELPPLLQGPLALSCTLFPKPCQAEGLQSVIPTISWTSRKTGRKTKQRDRTSPALVGLRANPQRPCSLNPTGVFCCSSCL